MKKIILLLAIGLASYAAKSQDSGRNAEVTYEECSFFMKTPPLRELLKGNPGVDDKALSESNSAKPINPMRYNEDIDINDIGLSDVDGIDPVLQSHNGTNTESQMRTNVNFGGQYGAFPPDPSGAAGIDYYVQAVNSTYRVYDKEGSPETPPRNLNTLWERAGNGDPIVMYDRFAERWFISQFYGADDPDKGLLIAVSVTTDPLGEYYIYEYDFTLFPDYPKYSVWSHSYFMSANSSSSDCAAFDRQKMLVGDPTAGIIKMTFPYMELLFNSVAPAYAEGPTEPEENEPGYFFAVQDNSYPGVSTDHIKVLKVVVDWDDPLSSDIIEHQEIPTAAFNSYFTGGFSTNLTQRGTGQKLDAIPGIFLYRAQYRRFATHNTIMLCNAVNVGGNRAGMRWYELRDNNDGIWAIHQQGTYSPDSDNSRWLGNLAMDAQGNIAMAYSFTGDDHYPGIRYTGRFKDDPLGEMTVPELTAIEGESAQTGGGRYGDYSQMSMDPTDDMTFWFTGEYIGLGQTRRTRIFSFSSWHIASVADNYKPIAAFNAYQPNVNELILKWNDIADEDVTVNVIDSRGRHILSDKLDLSTNERLLQLPNLASGIFFVSLTGEETNLTKKIYIGK